MVQGTKQETNTGGKAKMREHHRCTITSAVCSCRKHYNDECYHKEHLCAKLKSETENGSLNGIVNSGKGKDKSKGCGQSKEQGKGERRGPDMKPEKNQGRSGANLSHTLRQTDPEPSG